MISSHPMNQPPDVEPPDEFEDELARRLRNLRPPRPRIGQRDESWEEFKRLVGDELGDDDADGGDSPHDDDGPTGPIASEARFEFRRRVRARTPSGPPAATAVAAWRWSWRGWASRDPRGRLAASQR